MKDKRISSAPGFLMWIWLLLLFNSGQIGGEELEWRSMIPEHFVDRVIIETFGSESVYYGLEAHTPLVFSAQGPTRIRILSRLRYTADMSGEQSYGLIILKNGHEVDRAIYRTTPSGKADYIEMPGLKTGKAQTMEIAVDDTNRHTFEVHLTSAAGRRIETRLFKLKSNVDIIPHEFDRTVTALLSESRERTYYLTTRQHPVQVRIDGPTILQVLTRLDYNAGMIGKQMYSLRVSEDGNDLKTFHIESVRSSTVTYTDRPDVIPGALNTFEIEVPEGQHVYGFHLPNPDSQSVALRFLVPSKDLW